MGRVEVVEEVAQGGDARAAGDGEAFEVGAQCGNGCELTAARVLARDLERLVVEYRPERDQGRLDPGHAEAVSGPDHQGVLALRPVHDDVRRAHVMRSGHDDLGHRRMHSFESVDLCRRSTRRGRPRAGPEQSGSEGLLVRTRDRRHAVRVRKHPIDDSARSQSRDLIARHPERDGIPSTEDPE